jgi:hypothetical protein
MWRLLPLFPGPAPQFPPFIPAYSPYAHFIVAAAAVAMTSTAKKEEENSHRCYWFEMRALHFGEAKWRLHFRVSKFVFNFILDAIVSHDVFRTASHRENTAVGKQLAIFLFRVGSAYPIVKKIADRFEVSPWTVVLSTERVLTAINDRLGHFLRIVPGVQALHQSTSSNL